MHTCILLLSSVTIARAWSIQKPELQLPPDAAEKGRDAIDLFTAAYGDYKKYAWGHDSLAPLSKSFIDDRNGWGATIVDAMSTMKIMGLETPDNVSLWEKDHALIDRARDVGNKLSNGWQGTNDFPYNNLNFTSDAPVIEESGIAVAGTLILEWAKLAEYTGNKTYLELAEKSMRRIGTNDSPLPGLPAQGIDPSTGKPVGDYITWGGGSDSYFEYLIKYGRLTNNASPEWTSRWLTAVDSSIRYLAQTAVNTSVPDLLYLGDYTKNRTRAGTRMKDGDRHWPEVFAYVGPDGNYTGVSPSARDLEFYEKTDFMYIITMHITTSGQRFSSNFYAWRATGDIKYFNRAVSGLESIKKYCTPGVGVAGINDVRSTNSTYIDQTESFFFAEVIKYIYLTFDDPNKFNLDKYVFNTEAHPLEAPDPIQSFRPPQRAQIGGHLPSKSWTGQIPEISYAPGVQKKLSDVIEQGIDL
ncbi:glycosyl hydrolase 47 family [Rhizoctonia solani]|uniref:alpha-1,2-Mannosidase n=1 Tax=Rhizoctonia solani TaxID=456999 RepID=A0A8H7IG00_9AGAM|nr:glycosyl hydrolase 47 family [Rhizoctonia solani]